MVTAEIHQSGQDAWNTQLDTCINPNVFSTFEWGEYKKRHWHVERIVFKKGAKFVAQALILFKKIGPFRLGWCSSGINLTDYDDLPEIFSALGKTYDLRKTYIRFNFFDQATGSARFIFDSCKGLAAVRTPINSGYTIRFNKLSNIDSAKYSRNNRYYLKKASQNNLRFVIGDFDPERFCGIHNAMVSIKALDHLTVGIEDMKELASHWNRKLKLAEVYDGETCIAVALLIQHSKLLYYYLAGASEEGRKKSASFLMVDSILRFCASQNICAFDFGGITPVDPEAAGVNRFKMGFGGDVINYVGERNLCKSKPLTALFDFIISRKFA